MDRYCNPVARAGDFADPFVLRFDGRYYLYCTNPDVRCWSSSDLVHWRSEGPTIAPGTFGDLVPFAPEVVYNDGVFYMYTSPSGIGHHVLRSTSPTGPFETITGNVGREIDGTVLVDDDGRWYFYWAGDEGIWACEMASPTEFGTPVLTGAWMHGWTEGPLVVKHDGWFHMTLTGNHFLSPGYRINAAVSRSPLTGYVDDPLNPVLLSATRPTVGLGHSSTVVGPDLVSHYLVYHNLNPDRTRDLNVDRLVWNRQSLQVLGPTTSALVPLMPDHVSTGESGHEGWRALAGRLVVAGSGAELSGEPGLAVWSDAPLCGTFTAELNLTPKGDRPAAYGVLVLSADGVAAWQVRIDLAEATLALVDGAGAPLAAPVPLPSGYAHGALHCLRLVHDRHELTVVLDGRHQLTADVEPVRDGRLGYLTHGGTLRLGFTAVTTDVERMASARAPKAVPGRFWAALTAGGDGSRKPVASSVPFDRLVLRAGEEARYTLDVAETGCYEVFVTGDFADDSLLVVEAGPAARGETVPDGHSAALPVELGSGLHTLRIAVLRGVADLELVALEPASPSPAPFELTEPVQVDGDGKALLGGDSWSDGTVDTVVQLVPGGDDCHGDVIVRARHLADGFEGNDPRLGIDFLLGYSVQLHPDRLVVARHDYDERVLAERLGRWDLTTPHHVVVRCHGSRLTVRVDDAEVVEVDDPRPHLVGGAGLRVLSGTIRAERFDVLPLAAGVRQGQ